MEQENTKKWTRMSEPDLGDILERIDTVTGQRPSHKEVLEFLKGVLTEQFTIRQEVKTGPVDMDEKLIKTKANEGFPLVDRGDLKLDMAAATTLFERLCDILKRNKNVSGNIDDIKHAVSNKDVSLDELFKKTAADDDEYVDKLSERLNLNTDILSFLAKNSVKPIFEAYAHELEGYVDQERWWRNYCPICGSKPVMGALREREKKKFLLCSACGYEWRFDRIKCPLCENKDRKKLKYFHTEDEGRACRVEVCDKCKKYIKIVDVTELGEDAVLPVEDVGTLYLDVLAEKEGYTRDIHQLGFSLTGRQDKV